jgi:hypothetical protein
MKGSLTVGVNASVARSSNSRVTTREEDGRSEESQLGVLVALSDLIRGRKSNLIVKVYRSSISTWIHEGGRGRTRDGDDISAGSDSAVSWRILVGIVTSCKRAVGSIDSVQEVVERRHRSLRARVSRDSHGRKRETHSLVQLRNQGRYNGHRLHRVSARTRRESERTYIFEIQVSLLVRPPGRVGSLVDDSPVDTDERGEGPDRLGCKGGEEQVEVGLGVRVRVEPDDGHRVVGGRGWLVSL